MPNEIDTIYALASAPGKGGVAVLRVSGPQARAGLDALTNINALRPRQARLVKLRHPVSRETLDEALVVFFSSPASYTGEDVAEYFLHGGRAVVEGVLEALDALPGYRLAEPGEFTRRAFENGKIDLTGAEAVADLIAAETEAQRVQALAQMGGSLTLLYEGWRERLVRALAYLEADLDFPDEDLPGGIANSIGAEIEKVCAEISGHLDDSRRGERLREGIQVAILGAPNAGKSSLVNVLARREVAIVSDLPGTTRDVVEAALDLGGYPVILSDTAGLRGIHLECGLGHADIEAEGIRRALRRAEEADFRILLFDATALPEIDARTAALAEAAGEESRTLVVFNKCDLRSGGVPEVAGRRALGLSAKTGQGLDTLLTILTEAIRGRYVSRETPPLTRARHREALEACRESLARSLSAALPELAAEDVRLAVRALGRITGRVDVEDLLDVIFRDFCIGK